MLPKIKERYMAAIAGDQPDQKSAPVPHDFNFISAMDTVCLGTKTTA